MREDKPNPIETGQEHIPTAEEVNSVLRELIGKEFTPSRTLNDEQGLYLVDVMLAGDVEGEAIEYTYIRKGRHSTYIQSSAAEIHAVNYADGIPIGGIQNSEHGTLVARFVDGKWKIFK